MSSKLYVVVGGQFGSEGKGAVTGRICADLQDQGRTVVNVRVGGPNAGHTVLGRCPAECSGFHAQPVRQAGYPESTTPEANDAHPWRLRQVPVGAVTARNAILVIAAGSEVDPELLQEELRQLDSAGYNSTARLMVDRSATVLTEGHAKIEANSGIVERLGSTAKGIGAARADRIWRNAPVWGVEMDERYAADTAGYLRQCLERADHAVVVEGTQGYGLGIHTENYPYTTSGDCRAIDFLAQAGISPWQLCHEDDLKIVVCLRPYPIRVAGNSGPLLDETDWSTLGLPIEHTTVTNKVRRVGAWDPLLAREAVAANGGPRQGVVWVALTMMDSVDPRMSGMNGQQRGWLIDRISDAVGTYLSSIGMYLAGLGYVGTGPDTAHVNERMYY